MTQTTEATAPRFPTFKPMTLEDRDFIQDWLWAYRPETSELTFTNLFIWRHYYQLSWCLEGEYLILMAHPLQWGYFFFPPVGQGPRTELVLRLLTWLAEEKEECTPRIERADERLIHEVDGQPDIFSEPTEDHFDYVYRTADLIALAGRKYHDKKNHLNRFYRSYRFEYRPMDQGLAQESIHVLKRWCNWRMCDKSPFLRAEFEAVYEALLHFDVLRIAGGVILIDGRVSAFALGEKLGPDTAVIHAEKAVPGIPELFTVINQAFLAHVFSDVPFVNREQDLGEPGLRRAKRSYHPMRMVKKYRIWKNA